MVPSSARAETLLEIDNPAYAARIEADRKTTSVRSSEVRKRLDELAADAESQALFDAIDKAGNGFRTVRDDLVTRRKAGEALPPDAIANQLRPAADAYAAAVNKLAEFQRQRVAEAREAAARSERQGTRCWRRARWWACCSVWPALGCCRVPFCGLWPMPPK